MLTNAPALLTGALEAQLDWAMVKHVKLQFASHSATRARSDVALVVHGILHVSAPARITTIRKDNGNESRV